MQAKKLISMSLNWRTQAQQHTNCVKSIATSFGKRIKETKQACLFWQAENQKFIGEKK